MGLSVTFISGLRRSGKSAMIRRMIDGVWAVKPHYIRLVNAENGRTASRTELRIPRDDDLASARFLEYDAAHIFEILPAALTEIHHLDRFGSVVVEADADPSLRCAYPYDHRVFVMPMPSALARVFRDPGRAAVELQRVLDDTAAFATEIFGLFGGTGQDEPDPSEYRARMTAAQMRGFLHSPLGDELATRIQLQPPYHGLVESDVIIVNTGAGARGKETEECLRRLERLLERTRGDSNRRGNLFFCDPCVPNSMFSKQLVTALKPMGRGGS